MLVTEARSNRCFSRFRTAFPLFMKYVTGGYVSEPEAGERCLRGSEQ